MLFRRSIQPAEVGKRLKRELVSGSMVTVRGKVAPNDFLVRLEPGDAAPYLEHENVLGDDLADWLEEVAQAQNLTTLGVIRVRFEADASRRTTSRWPACNAVVARTDTASRPPPPALSDEATWFEVEQ